MKQVLTYAKMDIERTEIKLTSISFSKKLAVV